MDGPVRVRAYDEQGFLRRFLSSFPTVQMGHSGLPEGFKRQSITGWGRGPNRPPLCFFWSVPITVCASAMKFGGLFVTIHWAYCVKIFDFLPCAEAATGTFFVVLLFAELWVFRHSLPISALLRLALAIDEYLSSFLCIHNYVTSLGSVKY